MSLYSERLGLEQNEMGLFLETIETLKKIEAMKTRMNRIGQVVTYAFPIKDDSLLELNGQYVKRSEYPQLWKLVESIAIDDTNDVKYSGYFTVGDGVDTFRVPDYRGLFLRGLDNGRGMNPVEAKLGDYVADSFKAHKHGITYHGSNFDNTCVDTDDCDTSVNDSWGVRHIESEMAGGVETTPKYTTVIYYLVSK